MSNSEKIMSETLVVIEFLFEGIRELVSTSFSQLVNLMIMM